MTNNVLSNDFSHRTRRQVFRQSPKTSQSYKLPAFLLKFWAKRIVEIISKNQEPRESEILLHIMEIGNFGNSNWTNSNGAIRIRIRNQIDIGVREIIWCSQKEEFSLSCKLNDDDGKI